METYLVEYATYAILNGLPNGLIVWLLLKSEEFVCEILLALDNEIETRHSKETVKVHMTMYLRGIKVPWISSSSFIPSWHFLERLKKLHGS